MLSQVNFAPAAAVTPVTPADRAEAAHLLTHAPAPLRAALVAAWGNGGPSRPFAVQRVAAAALAHLAPYAVTADTTRLAFALGDLVASDPARLAAAATATMPAHLAPEAEPLGTVAGLALVRSQAQFVCDAIAALPGGPYPTPETLAHFTLAWVRRALALAVARGDLTEGGLALAGDILSRIAALPTATRDLWPSEAAAAAAWVGSRRFLADLRADPEAAEYYDDCTGPGFIYRACLGDPVTVIRLTPEGRFAHIDGGHAFASLAEAERDLWLTWGGEIAEGFDSLTKGV